MSKVFGISLLTACSIAIGGALLVFAPVSCACLDPVQHLLLIARLDYGDQGASKRYTTQQIADGIKAHMAGQQITPGQPHQYFEKCKSESSTKFTCEVEIEKSVLLTRNYLVTITTDGDGRLVDAEVEKSWSWF